MIPSEVKKTQTELFVVQRVPVTCAKSIYIIALSVHCVSDEFNFVPVTTVVKLRHLYSVAIHSMF